MALIRMFWSWIWRFKVRLVVGALQAEAIAILVFTEALAVAAMFAVVSLFLRLGLDSPRVAGSR